jgi:hypothetical protein
VSVTLRWLGRPSGNSIRIEPYQRLRAVGECLEVSPDDADRILRDHGDAFELVPAFEAAPASLAPDSTARRTSAMSPGGYVRRGSELLGRPWRDVVSVIESGDLDPDDLDALDDIEGSKERPRKSVLRAIAAAREA